MANALSPWAIGQNVLVKVQAMSRSGSSYALTPLGNEVSFRGKIRSQGDDYQLHTTDLTPMDSFQDNPVIYGGTGSFTLEEFESALNSFAGGQVSVLRNLLDQTFYARITLQMGTVDNGVFTATRSEAYYVQFSSRARSSNREGVMATATFQLILVTDTATGAYLPNPTISN